MCWVLRGNPREKKGKLKKKIRAQVTGACVALQCPRGQNAKQNGVSKEAKNQARLRVREKLTQDG